VIPAQSGKPPVQQAFATWHEAVQSLSARHDGSFSGVTARLHCRD
jgi:hypothetical protein